MPDLVLPIREPREIAVLLEQLRDAHRFLTSAARNTVPTLLQLPLETWGSSAKREYVRLPEARPALISATAVRHSFAEVVNQCATLERLIDTLAWANALPALHGARVLTCHPTTSSAPRGRGQLGWNGDHDLILEDAAGVPWKFEVSDVASQSDGNGKEEKDLTSLGIPPRGSHDSDWPSGRCHLVVSEEFAARIRRPTRHGLRLGLFHYAPVKDDGNTRIFEIVKGVRNGERGPRI